MINNRSNIINDMIIYRYFKYFPNVFVTQIQILSASKNDFANTNFEKSPSLTDHFLELRVLLDGAASCLEVVAHLAVLNL